MCAYTAPAWHFDPHAPRATQAVWHAAQFYDDDVSLCDIVANGIAEGVRSRQACLVVMTAPHIAMVRQRLLAPDTGISELMVEEDVVFVDAATTLPRFFDGRRIDSRAFGGIARPLLDQALARRPGRSLRAVGEMVNLLWMAGAVGAALDLERCWNGLTRQYRMQLLCGYVIGPASRGRTARDVAAVCKLHDTVHLVSGGSGLGPHE